MNHYGGYNAWKRTSAIATLFDFDQAQSVRPKGHCVTVRVTSEYPDDGFKETGGKVQELSFKSKPNAWAYFSVKSGGGIHELSDSQLGHAFAFGESGALAIANMVLGLKEIQIWGEIYTNVDFTIDLLNVLEYQEKKIHTGWLDSRIALQVRAERLPMHLSVVGGALYVLHPVSDYLVEVNLPTIQVIVGMGISLWQIPGIVSIQHLSQPISWLSLTQVWVYKLIQISRNIQRHSKAVSIPAVKHPRPFFMVALLGFLCIG
ncbi:hypothetical protein GIB67_015187 [Kingdonia uniflora]|uniref:Biotin carboxylation domain-containing protein n=1 Tax=Kingdonia uniflora TaxID=39325 RepID=A0A7J7LJ52_9MAGN|nr:hypothetical protein GIB67_015187 [Kingdonia uniflora]